jgi:hypothetical protein
MRSLFLAILLWLSVISAIAQPQLALYPAPDSAVHSTDYTVKVNGQPCFAYQNEVSAIAHFSFSGRVEIEITTAQDLRWVDIRPKHLGIEPVWQGHKLTFSLAKPANLSIELNGESTKPLYLFAAPPEVNVPSRLAKDVLFLAGGKIHDLGTYSLRSGQTVYIEGGAIVRGAFEGLQAQNLTIRGRGILEGSTVKDKRMIYFYQCQNLEIEGITMVNSDTWTLVPQDCRQVNINNVKIVSWKFGSDGIDLVATSEVQVADCFLRCNDDCIAIKGWGGQEKYPRTPQKGPNISDIAVRNTVFWNMAWGNAIDIGFELRCDLVSNLSFTDCDVIHVDRGAVFSIHNGDYATVQDVRLENIRVEDAMHKLIDLAIFLSQYSLDRPQDEAERKRRYQRGAWDGVLHVYPGEEAQFAANRGHIRNILFKNISVTDGQFPFSIITGYDAAHQVENVRIENLTVHGRAIGSAQEGRIALEHCSGIEVK